MGADNLLQLTKENVAWYVSTFLRAVRAPSKAALIISASAPESSGESRTDATDAGDDLSPGLLGFLLISIFVGATLNLWIPGREMSPGYVETAVVVLIYFLVYSLVIHLACRSLRGCGRFIDTLRSVLFSFSIVFVLANAAAMLWGIVATIPQITGAMSSLGRSGAWLATHPDQYLAFQFVLVAIYVPAGLKRVHGFGLLSTISIGILVPLIVLVFGVGIMLSDSILRSDFDLRPRMSLPRGR